MKILAILGTFVGVLAIASALYLQFAVADAAAIAESTLFGTHDESWYGSAEHKAVMDAMNWKTDLGIIVMFAGLAAVLMSIVPAIKKQKLAWLGVLAGLAAGLIGAMHGTKVNYILLTGFICDYAQAAKTEGQTFANSEEYRQYRHDRAMTKLNDEKEKLALAFPGIEIKCKAIEGVAIRAIESATRLYAPDLVVVGSSRLANAPTRNHASVATRLIGTLPANLLIVPYQHDCPTVKKIVYAYSKLEMNNEILKPFQFLIKKAKREVTMYHVIETEKDVFSNSTVEDFADFMEIKNVKIENVKSRNIVDNVLNYCENNKPDLLVVISREKTYMQDFWIGSKVDELSCQLRQPMLALYDIP